MKSLASLEAIFRPKSVAVIGASTVPGKLGHDILANLINGGFSGPIYPINPKAEEILGVIKPFVKDVRFILEELKKRNA